MGHDYIFEKTSTEGSYEECWAELINALKQPQKYSSQIRPDKVQPLWNEFGQFIKVGPAAMKINFNIEQGKVWLFNLNTSRCIGDFLCGVVKEEDRKNYVWFNSSLGYKDKYFPSRSVMK